MNTQATLVSLLGREVIVERLRILTRGWSLVQFALVKSPVIFSSSVGMGWRKWVVRWWLATFFSSAVGGFRWYLISYLGFVDSLSTEKVPLCGPLLRSAHSQIGYDLSTSVEEKTLTWAVVAVVAVVAGKLYDIYDNSSSFTQIIGLILSICMDLQSCRVSGNLRPGLEPGRGWV
jgi:hypothetical protein